MKRAITKSFIANTAACIASGLAVGIASDIALAATTVIVARTGTELPSGQQDDHWNFFDAPSFDGNLLAARAAGIHRRGVFAWGLSGTVRSIAEVGNGPHGTILDLTRPDVDAGTVVTSALVQSGQSGEWSLLHDDGSAAQRRTQPGFSALDGVFIHEGNISYRATSAQGTALYHAHSISAAATPDVSTGTLFSSLSAADIGQGGLVFAGTDATGHEGIYSFDHGSLLTIAHRGMEIPPLGEHGHHHPEGEEGGGHHDEPRTLHYVDAPVISGSYIGFTGADINGEGAVFIVNMDGNDHDDDHEEHGEGHEHHDFQLNMIATEGQLVPGGVGGAFIGFLGSPAIDQGMAVFQGFGDQGEMGIFAWDGNQLIPVLLRGDLIEGRRVEDMLLSNQSLRDGKVAYSVLFDDGSGALVVSTIPTPGLSGIFYVGAALVLRRRTRV
jgi:hypothetical protein